MLKEEFMEIDRGASVKTGSFIIGVSSIAVIVSTAILGVSIFSSAESSGVAGSGEGARSNSEGVQQHNSGHDAKQIGVVEGNVSMGVSFEDYKASLEEKQKRIEVLIKEKALTERELEEKNLELKKVKSKISEIDSIYEEYVQDQADQKRLVNPRKIKVVSALASSDYSQGYDAKKMIDNNLQTYWCTKSGVVHDAKLEFFFDAPSDVAAIHFYSPKKGNSYTLARSASVTFYNNSGEFLTKKKVELFGPYDEFQKKDLGLIENVKKVTIEPLALTKDIASYLTMNEVFFYGY